MAKTQAEYQKAYRERLKQKAAAGDAHAAKMVKREKTAQPFRNAKNFIKNHANIKQLRELRELTLDREKDLKQKK
ncbi:hypothetical protein [Lactobacillus mulieris]|uniref:Uncharacterized protein n=1 Tax=Lactobacillus mulieris TaxID=2508708 RepID=A0AAP3M2M5_9LACO|nr:hypothetical protein [Lactobacillus mulieris]MCW8123434.1 hypothetical protein [Lactobacillus mulieris]MCZ3844145.1 hypothetical protein [Lactobacillus mulieris]MCZ3875805.1 hypothetical protein [Lactobacillus mulieris]MDK7326597.1 hypothetical protein [Lactobacillus mulieris]